MRGVNASVVGLLLAALYSPVWTAGITSSKDFALGVVAFLLLQVWQVAPWLVVILSGLGAAVLLG
jgi:chromate transporter